MKMLYILALVALVGIACGQPVALPTTPTPPAPTPANTPQAATERPTNRHAAVFEVCTAALNLRACAGTSCQLVQVDGIPLVLERGAELVSVDAVTAADGGEWRRVRLLAVDVTGYVNSDYICAVE